MIEHQGAARRVAGKDAEVDAVLEHAGAERKHMTGSVSNPVEFMGRIHIDSLHSDLLNIRSDLLLIIIFYMSGYGCQ